MAVAAHRIKERTTKQWVDVVEQEEVVDLELTMEEATFLRDVMRRIGGDPGGSRRGIADRLDRVLGYAKIPHRVWTDKQDYEGTVYFKTAEEMRGG